MAKTPKQIQDEIEGLNDEHRELLKLKSRYLVKCHRGLSSRNKMSPQSKFNSYVYSEVQLNEIRINIIRIEFEIYKMENGSI